MELASLKKCKMAATIALGIIIPSFLFCYRDNPVDAKSTNYIAAKKPHATFLQKNVSAYLYDSIGIGITWSDTTVGGLKGAIKKFYFNWAGDTSLSDSVDGMKPDTFFIQKAFPPGTVTVRMKAVDLNGNFSDIDSMLLHIRLSQPRIDSIRAPLRVEKSALCTLSVFAGDSGGTIQSFLWAVDGVHFADSLVERTFQISFSDTGNKLILVKVLDTKRIASAVDSMYIHVFEKVFAVTYNGNDNTGGNVPVDSNKYAQGRQVLVSSNTGFLVRDGYTFTGWVSDPFYRGASYSPGAYFVMGNSDITLYAQWTATPSYSISYDGNGSTAGTVPLDTTHYLLGQTAAVRGNTGNLIKPGNTFIGWNTQANGSGISYASGVSFAMGSSNVTLYAQWTMLPTYTVTYDGNGGTGGIAPIDSNKYLSSALVTVSANTGLLVKAGYTFVGWNTKTNGTGTSYAAGVSFAISSSNVTLYAQWSTNPTFTVTYNGNGNTGGSAPVDVNNYLPLATVTLRNPGSLIKAGATFSGWNTAANGSGTHYAAGATFAMGNSNVLLYAEWSAVQTYTVTYDGNTSTAGTVPLDTAHYSLGQSVITRGNTGSLIKTGYTFVGWNTQPNGSGSNYATGVSFTMGSSNVILYAQWTAQPTFTVSYDGNGNTGGIAPFDNNNYLAGATVTSLGNSGALIKTGFTFVGWNTATNGLGTHYATGVTLTIGTTNVILYAQWTANPTFIIFYDGNGSTAGTAPIDANNYSAGATVTAVNPGSLVKTGYSFTGWNTVPNGSGSNYSIGATFAMGGANDTLYAQWALISTYTVSYNGNGNNGGSVPTDTAHYVLGQSVTTRGNTGALAKSGFTFVGWNTQTNGSGTSYATGVAFTMGSANVTLYAQWSALPTYTVTYDGNGSSSGSAPGDNNQYLSGAMVTVLGNTGTLTKTGNTFVGWNTTANGNGTSYAGGVKFAMGSANVTLYAQWSANPTYVVTYNGNGSSDAVPIDPNNYLTGALVTALNPGSLARAGYTFTGWNTAANGSGATYAVGATFAMGSSAVTLYAQWSLIPTYTVTYNGNGNSGGNAPTDPAHYQSGAQVTVKDTGTMVNSGYNFTGWNTLQNGQGTNYGVGATFIIGTSNITLYAQWTALPTFSIISSAGANGTISPPGTTVKIKSTSQVFTISANPNYHVADVQVDGNSVGALTTYTFSNIIASHAIVAVFAINVFQLTVNAGVGGSITAPTSSPVSLGYATPGTISASANSNYRFVIWTVSSGGGNVVLGNPNAATTTATITGNATIQANFLKMFTLTVAANNGSVTKNPNLTQYDSNSVVQLTATPAVGYSFSGWSGDASGPNPLSVTMNAAKNITATFTLRQYSLTINAAHGTVSKTPNQPQYDSNSVVQLTATPAVGYSFSGWSGDASGTANPLNITMNAAKNITAAFTLKQYSLTINAANGIVSKNPNQPQYDSNSVVQLTATPAVGYVFSGWSGDASGTANPLNVTMNAAKNITAAFTLKQYSLTINAANGIVSKNPNQPQYDSNSVVQLTATPAVGYVFSGWSGDASGSANPLNVTMNAAKNITATFTLKQYTLTITAANGTVSKTPNQPQYDSNSVVQLTATPAAGYVFSGWSGDASGTADPLNVTMNAAKNITATFTLKQYTLTITAANGTVSKTPNQPQYDSNSVVQLTATPAAGYVFSGWSGDASGTADPLNVTMNAAKNITATFTLKQYTLTITAANGTVSKTPNQPQYDSNFVVQLTVTPAVGYIFSGWSGDASGTADPLNVTMNAAKNITATFTLKQYTLTINAVHGTVSKSPDQTLYDSNSVVQLTVTPAAGYIFSGWSGDASGAIDPLNVTMNGAKNITATFKKTYQMSLSANPSAGGTVVPASPVTVDSGVLTPISATAAPGYKFSTWTVTGGANVDNPNVNSANVTLNGDATIQAVFTGNVHIIYGGNGNTNTGGVVPIDNNSYAPGQSATILDTVIGHALTRGSQVFGGWNTDPNGLGTDYPANIPILVGTSDLILYAKYQ